MSLDLAPSVSSGSGQAPPGGAGSTGPAADPAGLAALFAALLLQSVQTANAAPPKGMGVIPVTLPVVTTTTRTSRGPKDDQAPEASAAAPAAPAPLMLPPPVPLPQLSLSQPIAGQTREVMDTASQTVASPQKGATQSGTSGELLPLTTKMIENCAAAVSDVRQVPLTPTQVRGLPQSVPAAAPHDVITSPAPMPAPHPQAPVPDEGAVTDAKGIDAAPVMVQNGATVVVTSVPLHASAAPTEATLISGIQAIATGSSPTPKAPVSDNQVATASKITLAARPQTPLSASVTPETVPVVPDAPPVTHETKYAAPASVPIPSAANTPTPASAADATARQSLTALQNPVNLADNTRKDTGRKGQNKDAVIGASPSPSKDAAPLPPALASPANPVTVKAATPMPPADRAGMMQQIAQSVGPMQSSVPAGGQGQVTLSLHPKEWGRLNVAITMTPAPTATGEASGRTITAHIIAENPAVKAALETQTAELRRSLHEVGLQLEKLTVTLQSVGTGSQAGTAGGSGHDLNRNGGGWSQASMLSTSTTPGGSSSGGGQSPFAAFADSQGHRSPDPQATVQSAGTQDSVEPETQEVSAVTAASAGRVDTRA